MYAELMDFLSYDSPWSTTWLGDPQGVVGGGGKEIAAHALLYFNPNLSITHPEMDYIPMFFCIES